MRKHLLAIAVILTVATGCDNVAWGGIDVELKAPAGREDTSEVDAGEVAAVEESSPENERGPILLAGVRAAGRADLVVVGEILADGLHPFPDPRFVDEDQRRLAGLTASGTPWILFSDGARVGRLFVDGPGRADPFCGPRAAVSGPVELVPDAADAERFLALSAADAQGRPYEPYAALPHAYDQRVATLSVAGEAIPRYGATWPSAGVLDIRRHIQAFRLPGSPGASVAATFVYQDALAVGPPRQGAYALFVMAEQQATGYEESFIWYRAVDTEGKGVPTYFDHLDWDGDGSDEILLDVYGSNRRWFAALDREGGEWRRTFQDACGAGTPSG